jgi:hypothetical protein
VRCSLLSFCQRLDALERRATAPIIEGTNGTSHPTAEHQVFHQRHTGLRDTNTTAKQGLHATRKHDADSEPNKAHFRRQKKKKGFLSRAASELVIVIVNAAAGQMEC